MKTHSQKAHLYFNTNRGDHCVFDSGTMHETMPSTYILLSSQEVEFVVDKTDTELTQAQIDGLEQSKRALLAEAQMKAAQIDARIQSLLAITHEPA